MNRRFLNLIARTATGTYSINRMNTSQLFNRSTAVIAKDGNDDQIRSIKEIPELKSQRATTFCFQTFRSKPHHVTKGVVDVFSSFGQHKILYADRSGCTMVYDSKSHAVTGMPAMNAPKGPMHKIISSILHTGGHRFELDPNCGGPDIEWLIRNIINGDHRESVYIMDMSPRSPVPFEVLTFSTNGWVWHPLPCPQFFGDPKYKPGSDSCTVVDGTRIYFSPTTTHEDARFIGTHCFDTVTHKWEKAGDWVLPFLGKAEFLPELGLWLGLSPHSPHHLCAISSLDPPVVKDTLADLTTPEDWLLLDQTCFNLGSGRFCTVKFFDVADDDDTCYTVVVFTGVEVRFSDDGKLKMTRHESRRVNGIDVQCVL